MECEHWTKLVVMEWVGGVQQTYIWSKRMRRIRSCNFICLPTLMELSTIINLSIFTWELDFTLFQGYEGMGGGNESIPIQFGF